jgi:hypothetical protein
MAIAVDVARIKFRRIKNIKNIRTVSNRRTQICVC